MDICHRFSCHLHKRQKVELLRASPQMDTIQKVQGTGNLGQGVYQYKGFESNISYLQRVSFTFMKNFSHASVNCIFEGRSPRSRLSLFLTRLMTSPVVVGRSLRSPEGVWHCGQSLCRERSDLTSLQAYMLYNVQQHSVIYSFLCSNQSIHIIGSCNIFKKRIQKIIFCTFEQVWFRCGINHHNPEGSLWEEVPVPGEVVQISCGPGDLVWAVLWEGHLLVREGIGRDCLKGEPSGAVHSLLPSYHFLTLVNVFVE